MRITLDRWQAAQTAEFGHHQDLSLDAYITATNVIAKYLKIDYENDFKNKIMVQGDQLLAPMVILKEAL